MGQHLKTPLLLELLRHTDTESVLIFTRTKHRAKRLGEQLGKAGCRATRLFAEPNLAVQVVDVAVMAGSAIGTFRDPGVATDVAARGIDVTQISHVINYDMPDTADAYTHRIGRTGRNAKTGDASSFEWPLMMRIWFAASSVSCTQVKRCTLDGFAQL